MHRKFPYRTQLTTTRDKLQNKLQILTNVSVPVEVIILF